MKALSIKQPWADALVSGAKSIEVRRWQRWSFALRHVGKTIPIHAGQTWHNAAPTALEVQAVGWDAGHRMGGIIGTARLVAVCPFRDYEEWVALADKHLNPLEWYQPGLISLLFAEARRFEKMIECRGRLGFFEVSKEIAADVAAAIREEAKCQ